MTAASIGLKDFVKRYGDFEVVHGVDLDIEPGEFVVFVGPSGCGKSTLLRMIAGLEPISGGTLLIDGQPMNEVSAAKRGIARAQVALAWVASRPGVTAPIVGTSKPHHLDDALAALDVELSPEEVEELEAPYTPHEVPGIEV